MMNGDYAFFTFTDFPTAANLQPWTTFNSSSMTVSEYSRRIEAFYSIKLVSSTSYNNRVANLFHNRYILRLYGGAARVTNKLDMGDFLF